MWWIFWMIVIVAIIVGASVLIGRTISRRDRGQITDHEKLTALKASGALRNRKESRR